MPKKNLKGLAGHPLVSAVVTTYNRPIMLTRAIRSVAGQTYHPLEIIVVEDGLECRVGDWIRHFYPDVKYILQNGRRGLGAARNAGCNASHGKYVAYLDDDDEWIFDKIEKQVQVAETGASACAVVSCGARIIGRDGSEVGKNMPRLRGPIREAIRSGGLHTVPSSCMFKKEALIDSCGYDEGLRSHVDHDIWLRLARMDGSADFVPERLVRVHRHGRPQMTRDAGTRIEATRTFCRTWEPEWMNWFGAKEGKRYSARFKARVMAMLGSGFLETGKRALGCLFYLKAVRYDPVHSAYRNALMKSVLGPRAFERCSGVWKPLKARRSFS